MTNTTVVVTYNLNNSLFKVQISISYANYSSGYVS